MGDDGMGGLHVGALRPVGEPLASPTFAAASPPPVLLGPGYSPAFFGSGTEALAFAVQDAVRRAGSSKRILLPAYGCPDLVAAVVHAGAEPVLIDTAPDRPFMSVARVEHELGSGGAAALLIAHFLGLYDDVARWRRVADGAGISLIEDAAQVTPDFVRHMPAGDYVVASFGRGKPLNAGGGGMLLTRSSVESPSLHAWPRDAYRSAGAWARFSFGARRALYNLAIRPLPYAAVRRAPGLAIGSTRYRPVREMRGIPEFNARVLAATTVDFSRPATTAQAVFELRFGSLSGGWVDLPKAVAGKGNVPALLRYPVLAPSRVERNRVLQQLDRFGVSAFYGCALGDVAGLPPVETAGITEARRFADRVLTLPVHSGVSAEHASIIAAAVEHESTPGARVA